MSRVVAKLVEKRGAYYDRAEQLTPILGARVGTGVYIVRTRDKHIGRSLFSKEGRGEMQVLARAVTVLEGIYGPEAVEGKTFIDIGANIGTTTVPALLDHGFARAVALEPEEENFVTLRLNVLLNDLDDRVVPICKAASNQSGTSELVVNPEQGGKHWIATDDAAKEHVRMTEGIIEVETITLDELVEDGVLDPDLVGMIWIDAQAHEGHILEGAKALTSRGMPIVLEWDPRALDELGARGKIHDIAGRDYTHFAGMRADPSGEGPKFWLRPVDELDDYAQRFLDPSGSSRFTDIMILRLAEDEVPDEELSDQISLDGVIRRQSQLRETPDLDLNELDPVERARVERRQISRRREKMRRAKAERAKMKYAHAAEKESLAKSRSKAAAAEDKPTGSRASKASADGKKPTPSRTSKAVATKTRRRSGTPKAAAAKKRSSSGATKPVRRRGTSGGKKSGGGEPQAAD